MKAYINFKMWGIGGYYQNAGAIRMIYMSFGPFHIEWNWLNKA